MRKLWKRVERITCLYGVMNAMTNMNVVKS